MKTPAVRLTTNRKLALLLGTLGILALFAGNPYGGTETRLDAKELAMIVQSEVDHVAPLELARWIIQGQSDYRLIDLRSKAEYEEYHIPTAEHVTLAVLPDYGLARNEKIVLYSEGGIHSAQAWMLLRAQGYKGVYMVRGGLDGWKTEVLFPRLSPNARADESAEFEKMKAVSAFFGGQPQTGETPAESGTALAMPKLQMPPPAAAPVSPLAKKKKREGC